MAKYAIFFSYSSESWAAMVKNPSDRSAVARQLAASLGGTLESFYWMFGDFDGFAVADMPDSVSAAGLSVAVSSSGAFKRAVTTEVFDSDDQAAMVEKAKTALATFTPPTG